MLTSLILLCILPIICASEPAGSRAYLRSRSSPAGLSVLHDQHARLARRASTNTTSTSNDDLDDFADIDADTLSDAPEPLASAPSNLTNLNTTSPIWSINGSNLDIAAAAANNTSTPAVANFTEAPFNGSIWFNNETIYAKDLAPDLSSYFFCACNCSYVSWACCAAKNGIVHEPAGSNRGVLRDCTPAIAAGAYSGSDSATSMTIAGTSTSSAAAGVATSSTTGAQSPVQTFDFNPIGSCDGNCGYGNCRPGIGDGQCACTLPSGVTDINSGAMCVSVGSLSLGGGSKARKRGGVAQGSRKRFADGVEELEDRGIEEVGEALLAEDVLDAFLARTGLQLGHLSKTVLRDEDGRFWNATSRREQVTIDAGGR